MTAASTGPAILQVSVPIPHSLVSWALRTTPDTLKRDAFRIAGAAEPAAVVQHRRWTLGEILTAAASGGLCLDVLDEEPGVKPSDRTVRVVHSASSWFSFGIWFSGSSRSFRLRPAQFGGSRLG